MYKGSLYDYYDTKLHVDISFPKNRELVRL